MEAKDAPVVIKVTQTFGKKWSGNISIPLSATGLELKKKIAENTGEPVSGIKVLVAGKFLKNEVSLAEQKLKANAKLMVMQEKSQEEKQKIEEVENEEAKLSRLVSVAESLAERQEDEFSYNPATTIEIYNQHGQKMNLLPGDKKALTIGMTLHDRARALANKGDLKSALEIYLQADREGFSKCSKEILDLVDNYGILCLDISWTYFKLQSINNLTEASWRLDKAEEALKRTYGENMERLRLLKGGAGGAEMVNFVRLHLLQGVAAFHKGALASSTRFFQDAEEKMNALVITDEELTSLLAMGFTARESRIALRACDRNQERAVSYIFNKREEKRQAREREKKEAEERRERRRWGKTANGGWVDVQLLNAIAEAGFKKNLVAEGLRQTNNDELATMTLLTETPDLLKTNRKPKAGTFATEEKIQQLEGMGFSREQATKALEEAFGDVERATENLLQNKGNEEAAPTGMDTTPDIPPDEGEKLDALLPPEGEKMEVTKTEEEIAEEQRLLREKELKRQAEEDLLDSVEQDAEAHLDITLEEESALLAEYKLLLAERLGDKQK